MDMRMYLLKKWISFGILADMKMKKSCHLRVLFAEKLQNPQ